MGNPKIHFRNALSSDLDLTYKIKSTSIKPYVEKIWTWDELYQQESHKFNFNPFDTQLIIYNEKEVGYLILKEIYKEIYIENLLIVDEFQNLGIGKKTMATIIERANLKKKLIRLQVFKINIKAQKFYGNLGFVKISIKGNHILMEKKPSLS